MQDFSTLVLVLIMLSTHLRYSIEEIKLTPCTLAILYFSLGLLQLGRYCL